MTGEVEGWVVTAAALGLVILGVLVVVFRSESGAKRLGRFADRVVRGAAHLVRREANFDLTPKLLQFRSSTVELVRTRLMTITLANVVQQLMQFLVLFIALRGIQAGSSPCAAFRPGATSRPHWSRRSLHSRWDAWGASFRSHRVASELWMPLSPASWSALAHQSPGRWLRRSYGGWQPSSPRSSLESEHTCTGGAKALHSPAQGRVNDRAPLGIVRF